MKTKIKHLMIIIFVGIILSSCADNKKFKINENEYLIAEPYGWANVESRKNPNVLYEPCVGNIVWSIIGFETVILPVYLTGWSFYEPVKLKDCYPNCDQCTNCNYR